MTAQFAISLATSAGTIAHMIATGNRVRWAWLLGLANQVIWLVFIVAFGAWGLLPLSAALTAIYTRNHLRWRHTPDQDGGS